MVTQTQAQPVVKQGGRLPSAKASTKPEFERAEDKEAFHIFKCGKLNVETRRRDISSFIDVHEYSRFKGTG